MRARTTRSIMLRRRVENELRCSLRITEKEHQELMLNLIADRVTKEMSHYNSSYGLICQIYTVHKNSYPWLTERMVRYSIQNKRYNTNASPISPSLGDTPPRECVTTGNLSAASDDVTSDKEDKGSRYHGSRNSKSAKQKQINLNIS